MLIYQRVNHGLWKLGGYSSNSHFIWYFFYGTLPIKQSFTGFINPGLTLLTYWLISLTWGVGAQSDEFLQQIGFDVTQG